MKIDFKNKEYIINNLGIHDSTIENFLYNYDNREISIFLNNLDWNKKFNIAFNNVVYFEVQSCNFWGKGYNIIDCALVDSTDTIKKLEEKLLENNNYSNTILSNKEKLIQIKFIFNSGDTIDILCESIDFIEK